MKKALFYVHFAYYFPHFLPISKELTNRGYHVEYILSSKDNLPLMIEICEKNNLDYSTDEDKLFFREIDYVFFANNYDKISNISAKTIFLEHGVGTKSTSFYSMIQTVDCYLVEGKYKRERLEELYPYNKDKIYEVGFSKFDDIINMSTVEKKDLFHKYSIDPNKKTILYAPTFFPSSIEKMCDFFPDEFKDCNILIKPHYLTYRLSKYKKQRDKLALWSKFDNCSVMDEHEYSLLPFLVMADVMISDESSAMFEFAGLNKPVISNRYFKLRLSYYLFPWKLSKRIDEKKDQYRNVLLNAFSYEETISQTKIAINDPTLLETERKAFISDIFGIVDGKVSERIADSLETLLHKKSLNNIISKLF